MTSPGDTLFSGGAEEGDMLRWGVVSGATISSAQHRTGLYSYSFPNTGNYAISKPSSAFTEYDIRIAIRHASAPGAGTLLKFLNGASAIAHDLRWKTFGSGSTSFEMYDGTTLRVTTSLVSMLVNEWHVLTIYGKVNASVGVFQIKFDGTLIASFAGATNAQASADRFQITSSPGGLFVDDIKLVDRSGLGSSYLGDGGVLALLLPTGAGTYTDLIPSSGSAYDRVNDLPAVATSYIYESTAGKKSTFPVAAISGIPSGATIDCVRTILRAQQSAASGDNIATELLSGATLSQGSNQALTTAMAEYVSADYLVDPQDSAPWTEAKINALQPGAIVE